MNYQVNKILRQLIATPYTLGYLLSSCFRLKATPYLDAVLFQLQFHLGLSNNTNYSLQLIYKGTTTGGTWVSAGSDSSIEYNITGTSFNSTGARKITNAGSKEPDKVTR